MASGVVEVAEPKERRFRAWEVAEEEHRAYHCWASVEEAEEVEVKTPELHHRRSAPKEREEVC
jgi:hypothetical protein